MNPECAADVCQLKEHKGYDTCQRSGMCQMPVDIIRGKECPNCSSDSYYWLQSSGRCTSCGFRWAIHERDDDKWDMADWSDARCKLSAIATYMEGLENFDDAAFIRRLSGLLPPSSAPSVDIERVKAWFYSKPRKQAQAAFTAGDERQIAYMLEDAEAKVLLANQAKAVVAMNSAAQSARGTKFDAARYYKEYRDGLYGDGWQRDETTSHEHVDSLEATVNAALNLHGGHLIVPTADRAARTEEVPSEMMEVGVIMEVPDGDDSHPNTRFCSWNDNREGLPAGTLIYARSSGPSSL